MAFAVIAAVFLGGGLLLYALLHLLMHQGVTRSKGVRYPPLQTGWIPWVGCALSFGKEPLIYIQQTQQKFGDIFTIHAAGKKMTFITNPQHYRHYFTTTKTDFRTGVQPFTMGAANLPPDSFLKEHTALHDALKGKLIPSNISSLCPAVSKEFHSNLLTYGKSGEMNLMDFVRNTMFECAVKQMYGKDNVPQDRAKMQLFIEKFIEFDNGFEYGAVLPEIFHRSWCKSKYWLLSLFKLMVDGIHDHQKQSEDKQGDSTIMGQLMKLMNPNTVHNYALLMLWALQGNVIPTTFWSLAYILSNKDVHKSLKEDLKQLQVTGQDGEFNPLTEADLKRLMSVKRCVLEAIRLHSPGLICRKVVETHTIDGYTVPAGHMLILSPYWSHRNEEKFPNPYKFDPDRWLQCEVEKNQFLDGFVGFGGGRYQCPGRWFALMEMHIFVTMVLSTFDLELLDPLPSPSSLHLVGTQHPSTPLRIKFTRLY